MVGVCFDTEKGVLSFYLNGEALGPAFIISDFREYVFFPAVAML